MRPFCALLLVGTLALPGAESPRVGDAGSVYDPGRFDAAWPAAETWATAGVRGGIPARNATPLFRRIGPEDDLRAAIAAYAATIDPEAAIVGPRGVILLSPGRYPVEECLDLHPGLILRGEDPERTILEVRMRRASRWVSEVVGVRMRNCRCAALEDLTILHPAVEAMAPAAYRDLANDQGGIDDLKVGHVFICLSEDCWIQNCRLLYAGTDPLIVNNSRHITLRDNQVRWCFNKGGGGNGYYLIHKSHHVLCFNEFVEGIRHFTIQTHSSWNAVIDCYLIGDLNFHYRDGGHNLIEGCAIRRPRGHHWGPIACWQAPRGDENLLWNVEVGDRFCKGCPADPAAVHRISTGPEDLEVLVYPLPQPVPRSGTLYPVTGQRLRKQILSADEERQVYPIPPRPSSAAPVE
jgi:hypothetical protein